MDYNYRQTTQLVARLELLFAAVNAVWAVQQDIQTRSRAVAADRSLPAEVRDQQLGALANEAGTRISAVLGKRGFEAYRHYGGQWMQQLQPRPDGSPVPVRPQGFFLH